MINDILAGRNRLVVPKFAHAITTARNNHRGNERLRFLIRSGVVRAEKVKDVRFEPDCSAKTISTVKYWISLLGGVRCEHLEAWPLMMANSWSRLWQTFNEVLVRPGVRAAVNNFRWLVAEKLVRLMFTAIVGFWVARYLGPVRFGTLNYCMAWVALFGVIPELGLEAVVKRHLISHPKEESAVLAAAFGILKCPVEFLEIHARDFADLYLILQDAPTTLTV